MQEKEEIERERWQFEMPTKLAKAEHSRLHGGKNVILCKYWKVHQENAQDDNSAQHHVEIR